MTDIGLFLRKHALQNLYGRWQPEDEEETDWLSLDYSKLPHQLFHTISHLYCDWNKRQDRYRFFLTKVIDGRGIKIVIDVFKPPYLGMVIFSDEKKGPIADTMSSPEELMGYLFNIKRAIR